MALCQTKLVVQYIIQFKLLAAPLKDLLEKLLKAAFMNGLVDEIKFKVRLFGPKNLGQTMDLARNIEKNYYFRHYECPKAKNIQGLKIHLNFNNLWSQVVDQVIFNLNLVQE